MTRILFSMLVILQLFACQSTDSTSYGLYNNFNGILDLREQNITSGTQEEITNIYKERIKAKTDGQIILIKAPFPVYPRADLEAGIQGIVIVEFIVNKKGKVIQSVILRSDGEDFEKASLACLKRWRFESILKDGLPVEAKLRHAFQFLIAD